MKQALSMLMACVFVCLLAGCDKLQTPNSQPDEGGLGGSVARTPVQSAEAQFRAPQVGDTVAVFATSAGDIEVLLFPQYAPQAVENLRLLAAGGYYKDTAFHRVVNDFIIQGGDPTGSGIGGESAWGNTFPVEITDKLHHYTGALCMVANGPPPTCRSQFYFVACAPGSVDEAAQQELSGAGLRSEVVSAYAQAGGAPYLDNTDTVFGQVYAGMDVVDAICGSKTDDNGTPAKPVTLLGVTVTTYTGTGAQSTASAASQPVPDTGDAAAGG